jgi:DNA polymerase-3 subunit alpha (Gram-positive type)
MFLGIHGDIPPNIDLYVAREYEDRAVNELKVQMENHESNSTYPLPNIFSHDGLSIMKRLHSLTKVSPKVIPMNDPKVLSLFRSTAELGVTPEQVKTEVATYGIPEMGIGWVREILEQTQPSSFSELVQIIGLSHGTGAWEGNARERIQVGAGSLATSIAFRDQLMMELIEFGMEMHTAYAIAQSVRKGKISVSCSEAMLKCNVPDWYIESCLKIKYLFPKSQAVSYVISAVRYAFYKLYYPLEFYAAYFTVRGSSLDMELCAQGSEAIKKSLEEAQHEVDRSLLGLALEMTVRGIRIKKTNHSTGHGYVIVDDKNSLEVPLE